VEVSPIRGGIEAGVTASKAIEVLRRIMRVSVRVKRDCRFEEKRVTEFGSSSLTTQLIALT
jgi:hypothetical protein